MKMSFAVLVQGAMPRLRVFQAGCIGRYLVLSGIMLIASTWWPVHVSGADEPINFNRDVRPILSDRCFACHGHDSGAREGDLRLDVREDAVADRGGYYVVTPGKPKQSELIARIESDDDDMRMPPTDFGKPLSKQQRDILVRWIAQGAPWERHWSLRPLVRPQVPSVKNASWVRNEIDRFVLRRLQAESLAPAKVAEQRTLVRRLYVDVTGLPPRPEEVAAFVQETGPQVYEAMVDRLLASPHYGERMAMYWLDLVRYADTLGYHGDQQRSVSPYRDYVIQAFNDNMPFDQFTIENLAGDLLPEAGMRQKIASTYNRLNRASAEGGVQPKEYLAKYAADRVRTTGSVWLGSTLGCAECHDHKFDPFTTKDFYRFAAYFADIKEQGIVAGANHIEQLPVPTPLQQRELRRLDTEIAAVTAELQSQSEERQTQFRQWQQQLRESFGPWVLLQPEKVSSTNGTELVIQPDGSILAKGKRPATDIYTIEASVPLNVATNIRLDALTDPSLPAKGPGRAGNGNFVVQRFKVTTAGRSVKWKSATATHSQAGFEVAHLANGNAKGWAILPTAGKLSQVVLVADKPMVAKSIDDMPATLKLTVKLTQNHGDHHTLGRFRLYTAAGPKELTVDDIVPQDLVAILAIDPARRTAAQAEQLWGRFRVHASVLAPQREKLAKLKAGKVAVEKGVVTTLATSAGEPRVTRALPRGNWMDDSGEVVTPGVPHFLCQEEVVQRRATRLDLARWLVDRDNPLTARALVNRLWMLFFGQGISRSVDDLGSQGEWPSHLDLLDWLAVELIDSGWDIKHVVRLMVTSSTYRQSSRMRAELRTRDPYNQLLARQSRWRIDAELVRDNALAVCGLLQLRVGGPSVRPYQPAGYWAQLNFPKRTYQQDDGEDQYRRGVYAHWQRTFLHPSLLAFDAPVREECTARRDRSNTPLQALVLMNDPTYVEAARVLAGGAMRCGGASVVTRLTWMFQQALQRDPTSGELEQLGEFYARNEKVYRHDATSAARLLAIGLAENSPDLDQVEMAAWTCVARAILNLHETITRY